MKIYYEGGGNKEYAFFNKSINYETIFCVGGNTVGGVLAGVETQLAAEGCQ